MSKIYIKKKDFYSKILNLDSRGVFIKSYFYKSQF